ncbi:MAG: hypothetical protein IPH85_05830 [Ignavibacteria bacterium]|nr:hypothetical protein [Ignavibacteria bacterium]
MSTPAADDVSSLRKNAVEALELYFSEESRVIKPQQIALQLELTQLFAFYNVINSTCSVSGMNESLGFDMFLVSNRPVNPNTQKSFRTARSG